MGWMFLALFLLILGTSAWAQQPCRLDNPEIARVIAVRDGRTLVLDDGRELRLAAIEIRDDAPARAALQALVTDAPATFKPAGHDRYGRIVAYSPLQHALLTAGHAVVGSRPGDKACATDLLAAENAARAAKRGIWAHPNFAPLRADDGNSVAAQRGRFTLIEGKVLSVRESGSTIYVNFGRNFTRDFTVTILKRNQRMFASAGLEPKSLDGRRVRVRGFVEQRNGPIIEAARPEQIEIVE